MKNYLKNIGPGMLVTSAFIGPGTVTVCTLAGLQFGFSLLWALALSILATIILQEMSARIGLVTGEGLSQVLRTQLTNPLLRKLLLVLVFAAIVLGNAAYEAGNIGGGVLGLQLAGINLTYALAGFNLNIFSLILGGLAFFLLYFGSYKLLEPILIGLVILMSLSFMITAVLTRPDWLAIIKNVLIPKIESDQLLTVIALIGTTVVPYNIFLHASLVNQKWRGHQELKFARVDTVVAIILGGLVSMSVVIAAASVPNSAESGLSGLAKSLEPLYGQWAQFSMSIGLFAAGLTSAITAPLAAAYVAEGCFGFKEGSKDMRFKFTWMLVVFTGTFFASIGIKPLELIQFAQVANGLLLPIIAGVLVWLANKTSILGVYKNSWWNNLLGLLIILLSIILGLRTIFGVIAW